MHIPKPRRTLNPLNASEKLDPKMPFHHFSMRTAKQIPYSPTKALTGCNTDGSHITMAEKSELQLQLNNISIQEDET